MSGAIFPPPNWAITVTEIDGSINNYGINFTVGNERHYLGFMSDIGISEVVVADGSNTGAANWSYDNVSRSLIQTAVPIPASVWLFGSGLLGLVGMARRKKAA